MFSEVNEVPKTKEQRKYPYIGRISYNLREKIYVLFYDESRGVVVNSTASGKPVGYNYNCWNESAFEVTQNRITLGND